MIKLRKKLYDVLEETKDNDIVTKIYNYFMMFIIVVSIIPICFKTQTALLNVIDKVSVGIFIMDYCFRWIIYDFKKPGFKRRAFIAYPFSFFAVIDILSILPSITVMSYELWI